MSVRKRGKSDFQTLLPLFYVLGVLEQQKGGKTSNGKLCFCNRRSSIRSWKGDYGGVSGETSQGEGYQVTMQKFDPYINVDPGTMNPIQHGRYL